MRRSLVPLAGALIIALIAAASSLFTVQQVEQVLITQFGKPVRVIDQPGLHAKIPLVQTVISFDRRLQNFEMPGEEVILGIEADVRRRVDAATEKCKAAKMPPLDILTTDVYADGGFAWRN